MDDWDDLRMVLAVAREGSLSGGARRLGVTHSTISRRLTSLEGRLGVRLFERVTRGWVTTAAGDDMVATAQRLEEEVAGLDRRVQGRDTRLSGCVRVATADILATHLMPHMGAFMLTYPDVALEVVIDRAAANLTAREADVALRATNDPPESLVGRRLTRLPGALYAHPDYLARHPERVCAEDHDWIAFDDSMADLMPEQWLRRELPDAHVVLRSNHVPLMLEAAREGLGVAFMLCFVGDAAGLQRVDVDLPEMGIDLWILTHRDLRTTARVRAFMDFMAEAVRADLELLEGRRPAAA